MPWQIAYVNYYKTFCWLINVHIQVSEYVHTLAVNTSYLYYWFLVVLKSYAFIETRSEYMINYNFINYAYGQWKKIYLYSDNIWRFHWTVKFIKKKKKWYANKL